MNINLRKDFKKTIDDHGHWVVLRQAVPDTKCSCVIPITDGPKANCKLCLGSGYLFVDRFAKCRKSRDVRLTQTLGAETRTAIRMTSPTEAIFYFEYTTKPTVLDYILEIALNEKNGEPIKPYKILSIYDIGDVREHRDQKGRIEFYSVTAERQLWSEFRL